MTIVQATPPAGGQQAIAAALSHRMPHAGVDFLSPLGGSPATGAPLPMYNIRLDDAQRPNPLAAATLVGWRYPVIGGPEAGLAHLSANAADPEYGGLTRGYLPQRLIAAALVAQERLGDSEEHYEARLLQMPALRIVCLWLAGEAADHFVVLTDGKPSDEAHPLQMIDDIRPVIKASRGPGGPSSPVPDVGPTNAD